MWTDCGICNGRGWGWVDTGHECPTKATCGRCRGLGFAPDDWVEPAGFDPGADLYADADVARHWDRPRAA